MSTDVHGKCSGGSLRLAFVNNPQGGNSDFVDAVKPGPRPVGAPDDVDGVALHPFFELSDILGFVLLSFFREALFTILATV